MLEPTLAHRRVERVLVRAAAATVRGLCRELDLSRRAAAEAYATTSGLVPSGLALRTRRRPLNARAAFEVVKKYGRPMDVAAPELGIAGRLARDPVSPRLGGLLGDAGPRAVRWIAERTGAEEQAVARAVAATAPIVLGALERALEPRDLGDWVATLSTEPLESPGRLAGTSDATGRLYRRLASYARPWWGRTLRIGRARTPSPPPSRPAAPDTPPSAPAW